MNRFKWIAVVSTAFLLSLPSVSVYGQNGAKQEDTSTIDAGTLACRYVLKLDDSDRQATMAYYQGFISGKKNELIVDVGRLGNISERVIDHCIDNPNDSLITVFEQYRKN
ncbi:MAG: HdeA/HdeB family chaperone [Xenococcaceae cyanobacterium]